MNCLLFWCLGVCCGGMQHKLFLEQHQHLATHSTLSIQSSSFFDKEWYHYSWQQQKLHRFYKYVKFSPTMGFYLLWSLTNKNKKKQKQSPHSPLSQPYFPNSATPPPLCPCYSSLATLPSCNAAAHYGINTPYYFSCYFYYYYYCYNYF